MKRSIPGLIDDAARTAASSRALTLGGCMRSTILRDKDLAAGSEVLEYHATRGGDWAQAHSTGSRRHLSRHGPPWQAPHPQARRRSHRIGSPQVSYPASIKLLLVRGAHHCGQPLPRWHQTRGLKGQITSSPAIGSLPVPARASTGRTFKLVQSASMAPARSLPIAR